MITIFTAMYVEAKPIIDYFHMKLSKEHFLSQVYVCEEYPISLVITGVGSIHAAMAVTNYYTKCVPDSTDILINLGCCAGNGTQGSIYFCGKIVEQATGRTFFPDLLYHSQSLQTKIRTVISVSKVLENGLPEEAEELYDQEAAAIYQAANCFLEQHKMLFYKVIVDAGEGKNVTAKAVESVIEGFCKTFFGETENEMIETLQSLMEYGNRGCDLFSQSGLIKSVNEFGEALKCSETMKRQLKQHIHYAYLCKVPVLEVMEEFYEKEFLPVRDKRAGKIVMEEFFEEIERRIVKTKKAEACIDMTMSAAFSTVYVEEGVLKHPKTKEILAKFPNANQILIHHYKDVFNRKAQNFAIQEKEKALIIAEKKGTLVYPGAKVCQSFGNEHFYYTSCIMNCIYSCEYCYLKGMYPSGNMVIFVNLHDIFTEIEELLKQHPVYVCVSYDTDLLALEGVTGFVKEWIEFAKKHESLRIEIRTKCGNALYWEQFDVLKNVIFAFTVSPEQVIARYEHKTSNLKARLLSAKMAMEKGFQVRLCFDPMILCDNWRETYDKMIEKVEQTLELSELMDVSIGSFRISQEYLKKMRKALPNSAVVQYPYENKEGVYQYRESLREEMEQYLCERLGEKISGDKIFRW